MIALSRCGLRIVQANGRLVCSTYRRGVFSLSSSIKLSLCRTIWIDCCTNNTSEIKTYCTVTSCRCCPAAVTRTMYFKKRASFCGKSERVSIRIGALLRGPTELLETLSETTSERIVTTATRSIQSCLVPWKKLVYVLRIRFNRGLKH